MMMKKLAKCFLTGLCLTTILTGTAACGKTAYDVAVKNGFQGTE